MDWQMIASVFCGVSAALVAVIWGQITHTLGRIGERLEEVGRIVHGHEIRLDMIEDREHGR